MFLKLFGSEYYVTAQIEKNSIDLPVLGEFEIQKKLENGFSPFIHSWMGYSVFVSQHGSRRVFCTLCGSIQIRQAPPLLFFCKTDR